MKPLRQTLVWRGVKSIWHGITLPARLLWKPVKWSLTLPHVLKALVAPFVLIALMTDIGVYYVLPDMTTRLLMSSEPTATTYPNPSLPKKGIFLLGGAGVEATKATGQILPVLQEFGTVELVENSLELFDKDTAIRFLTDRMRPYEDVTLVGLSMGGILAHDLIHEVQARGPPRQIKLVLVDSPTRKEDVRVGPPVVDDGMKFFSFLHFGAISNWWLSPGAPESDVGSTHARDVTELKALWQSYDDYLWSAWGDQGRFVFQHDPLMPLSNVDTVFIRSSRDTFVLDSCLEGWRKVVALPDNAIFHVNARHVSLLDEPDDYEKAFRLAFERLGHS